MSRVRRVALRSLARVARERPLPLSLARVIARAGLTPAVLRPLSARALASHESDRWGLDAWTLQTLRDEVYRRRPKCVLEFGSGASTVSLAQFMAEAHDGGTTPTLVSFEQDEAFAAITRKLLNEADVETHVHVIDAPMRVQSVEGVQTTCYAIDVRTVFSSLPPPEMVIIDGPSGPSGCRFGTVPLCRNVIAKGARFFLDDALRAGELDVLERWKRLSFLRIEGVILRGKGLGVGRVVG